VTTHVLKIVITGGYATGKTQFVRSISDIDPVSTEQVLTTTTERVLKHETTVAMDFGSIAINDQITLHLFGTPGHERFDFMREHLLVGCLGYVVLVDSCRPAQFTETQYLLFRSMELTEAPFVVAANRQDDPAALPLNYIRRRLGLPFNVPLVPCVATDRTAVRGVLLALLKHIAARLTLRS
jgi:hypothetical protein